MKIATQERGISKQSSVEWTGLRRLIWGDAFYSWGKRLFLVPRIDAEPGIGEWYYPQFKRGYFIYLFTLEKYMIAVSSGKSRTQLKKLEKTSS